MHKPLSTGPRPEGGALPTSHSSMAALAEAPEARPLNSAPGAQGCPYHTASNTRVPTRGFRQEAPEGRPAKASAVPPRRHSSRMEEAALDQERLENSRGALARRPRTIESECLHHPRKRHVLFALAEDPTTLVRACCIPGSVAAHTAPWKRVLSASTAGAMRGARSTESMC